MSIKGSQKIIIIILTIIGLQLFGAFAIKATASDTPSLISFFHLRSTSEKSALSGKCTGDISIPEIDCYLVQTRIRLKSDPKELPDKLQKIEDEIEKAKKETKEMPLKLSDDELCTSLHDKNKKAKLDKKLKGLEHTSPQTYAGLLELISICNKPSYEKMLHFLKKDAEAETRTCLISSDTTFETIHLKKIGPRKWLGTAGPGGLCNVVTTWTLEHEPTSIYLWTFTQIGSHADQTNKICKEIEVGIPLIYSWQSEPLEMQCDFIEFGL